MGIDINKPLRILHTMLRVSDLEKSVQFYEMLGMKELRREDYPNGEFTLVFIGYGNETKDSVLELTYNHGENKYTHGDFYGHIALEVNDIYVTCEQLKNKGIKVLREAGPMNHIASNGAQDIIAFIEDPDGYKIELIEEV